MGPAARARASRADARNRLDIAFGPGAAPLRSRISRPRLRRVWLAVLAAHASAPRRVSLAFVGDAAMAKLHVEFSGVEGTTDVLSFDYRGIEAAAPPAVEAEVVVCVDVALRESRRRGLRFHDELELYWIHGLLHACGLDDHSVRDRRAMRRAERSVFVSLGGVPRRRPLR